ncbi:MAG: hypothetical protein MPJ50_09140 [Pirellulales bacterium]|nr:hypothetical protein [Pirellulales bacterium]
MRGLRIFSGVAIWLLLVLGLLTAWNKEQASAKPQRVASEIWTYYTGDYQQVRLNLPQQVDLGVGDPIFYINASGEVTRIGEVTSLTQNQQPSRRGWVKTADAMFYPRAPAMGTIARAEYYSADQSLIGTLRTMLPDEKRQEISQLIVAAYREHNQEVAQELWPIVHATLKETMRTLETELAFAFAKHREELRAVGARYQQEIIAQDVIPLVREEVWPIVRARGEPMANQIGQEVWERVSLWRFGWRMVYDKTPLLPTRNYTQKEWRRFVDSEIVPILETHTDDLVHVTKNVLRDVGKNAKVRQALRKNLSLMLDDPELQRIFGSIIREVVIERDSLRATFKRNWSTPESQQALQLVSARLEPTARKIGELILGTRERISPEFALVLRNHALAKDRRWICIFEASETAESKGAQAPTAAPAANILTLQAGQKTPEQTPQTTAGTIINGVISLTVSMGESAEVNPFASLVEQSSR